MRKTRLVIFKLLVIVIGATGFFLSIWVILPAPIFNLLPLAIGAPEVSPWLWLVNILAGGLGWQLLRQSRTASYQKATQKATQKAKNPTGDSRLPYLILGFSSLGLLLSLSPIIQFPAANQAAQVALEKFCQNLEQRCEPILKPNLDSLTPNSSQTMLRPQPFVLKDVWGGIPSLPVRYHPEVSLTDTTTNTSTDTTKEPLTLEVYRPLQQGSYPAIVIIHGGAWQGGSPKDNAEFNRYMAARGYVVWAITYRHAPKHRFPAQIEDVRTALRYIQNHALEYDTDLTRVALMGRSAGAHLAMLAAYDTPSPPIPPIRAVVNYYGPVDLTAGYYDLPNPDPINSRVILRDFLGGTPDQFGELYKAASPITYVNRLIQKPLVGASGLAQGSLPPSLLIYGRKDHLVMAKFGKALAEKLLESGNQSMFLEIPWADHSFDAIFSGISNQLALYYTERFLAIVLAKST